MNADMKVTMWAVRGSRILAVTLCSVSWYSLVNIRAAFAANDVTSNPTTTTTNNGGLLIGLGAGVLIIGGIGFFVLSYSRKKRHPSQCAEQRETLADAERALHYWEGALAHIQAVDRDHFSRRVLGVGDEADLQVPAASDVDHEALLAKSQSGYAAAERYRDQCQLDLIHCMARGGGTSVSSDQLLPQPPAIPFDLQ